MIHLEDVKKQIKDPFINAIRQYLSGTAYTLSRINKYHQDAVKRGDYVLKKDVVYYKNDRIYIPKTLICSYLLHYHCSDLALHPGKNGMYQTLKAEYYWPGMFNDIALFVKNCHICQLVKGKEDKLAGETILFPAKSKWEQCAIDIIGPVPPSLEGHTYILTIIDRFSRYAKALPMYTATTVEICQLLLTEWIYPYEPMKTLLSDLGSQFVSKLAKLTCTAYGIKQIYTSGYHPQTNGLSERFNKTVKAKLNIKLLMNDLNVKRSHWNLLLSAISAAYNKTIHSAIKMSPHQLIYGTKGGITTKELDQSLIQKVCRNDDTYKQYFDTFKQQIKIIKGLANENQKQYHNQRIKQWNKRKKKVNYKNGELVTVYIGNRYKGKNDKAFNVKSIGPYQIQRKINNNCYVIVDPLNTSRKTSINVRYLDLYHLPSGVNIKDLQRYEPIDIFSKKYNPTQS